MAIGCGPKADPVTSDSGTSTSGTTDTGTSTSTGTANTGTTGNASTPTVATTTSGACDSNTGDCSDSVSSSGCNFLNCDDSVSSSGCSFLNCDDFVTGLCECDGFDECCPDGEKCTAYISGGGGTWDANKCVDVTGTDEPGDECTSEGAASGIDSCIKGAMCWSVDDMGVGTCVALCTGSSDAPVCADDVTCTIANDGVLNLCLPNCDPLLQDCLDAAEACYPINDGFTCAPDASGEEGQANDACAFINTCDKSLMCADAAIVGAGCEPPATGCCTPFCEFPDGTCPNPDQKCVQYFVEPFPMKPQNSEDIGVCGIPQ